MGTRPLAPPRRGPPPDTRPMMPEARWPPASAPVLCSRSARDISWGLIPTVSMGRVCSAHAVAKMLRACHVRDVRCVWPRAISGKCGSRRTELAV